MANNNRDDGERIATLEEQVRAMREERNAWRNWLRAIAVALIALAAATFKEFLGWGK
jgi:hypothetical protein